MHVRRNSEDSDDSGILGVARRKHLRGLAESVRNGIEDFTAIVAEISVRDLNLNEFVRVSSSLAPKQSNIALNLAQKNIKDDKRLIRKLTCDGHGEYNDNEGTITLMRPL